MKQILNKKTKKKGFTLIELIIVIAVIGIIAAIAVPSLMGTKETFKIKADEKSAQTVARAVELLIVDETIPAGASGTITINTNSNPISVTTDLKVATVAVDTTKINTQLVASLEGTGKPQEKDKVSYKITLENGKVTSKTTEKAPAKTE